MVTLAKRYENVTAENNETLANARRIEKDEFTYPYSNEELTSKDVLLKITDDAILDRVEHNKNYVGNTNRNHNKEILQTAIRRLVHDKDGNKLPPHEFEKALYALYGSVFTGHPTSNKTLEQAKAMAHLQTLKGNPESDAEDIDAAKQAVLEANRQTTTPPSLDTEAAAALATIGSIHEANDFIADAAMEVAQEEYPDNWMQLNYMPLTVATWIPFDWDGRTDVTWNQLMERRVELQVLQMDRYLTKFTALQDSVTDPNHKASLQQVLEELKYTKETMAEHQAFFRNYDPDQDPNDELLKAEMAKLKTTSKKRLTNREQLIGPIQQILVEADDKNLQEQLVSLRSDIKNNGLSFAQIHFRINAKSIMSALGEHGLEIDADKNPEDADAAYFDQLSQMVGEVERKQSNLLDAKHSNQTIIKQMTMIGQFDEFVEEDRNVRFLMAETDRAIVPLGALYFAKKLGIEDKISISGLCEDRDGQEHFKRLSKKLMTNEDYARHITAPRNNHPFGMAREADQYGYSDSGRYDGVFGAGAHMELARGQKLIILGRYQRVSTADIHLINFGTGGQSDGRQQHPDGPAADARYKDSGFIRHKARQEGIKLTTETSFQGMDGNILLLEPDSAIAYFTQIIDYSTDYELHAKQAADPYYQKDGLRQDAYDFIEIVRNKHAETVEADGYSNMIDQFMRTAPKTGSRPVKRPGASGGVRPLPRAIQHNGTLMRLAQIMNLIDGLHDAIKENPERFDRLMESDQFKFMFRFVEEGMKKAIESVMQAEVELYNPEFWKKRAADMKDGSAEQERALYVGSHMERLGIYENIKPVADEALYQYQSLKDDLKKRGLEFAEDAKKEFNRKTVHGHKVAGMIKLFESAMDIPDIPSRHKLSREEAIDRIFKFDATLLEDLKEVFSPDDAQIADDAKSELAAEAAAGYSHVNDNVILPLEEQLLEISEEMGHILIDLDHAVG